MRIRNSTGRRIGMLLLTVALALPLSAATPEPTEERFIPNFAAGDLYYLWSTRTDLESIPGATLQVQEAGIRAPVPVFSNERTRLTAGLHLRWNHMDFEGFAAPLDLYRLQFPVDFWHSFNDRWKAWGRVEPGLFTDFKEVNGDALAVTVLALVSYQFTPEFSTAFGVYYSRDLGEDRALPALGIIWKPDPHWNVGLTFPRASVAYAPNKKWLFTAFMAPGGAGWTFTDPGAAGTQLRLDYRSWRGALGAEYEFTRAGAAKFWAFVAGGCQFGQELEVTRQGVTVAESDLSNGQFVTGGIRLRF